MNYINSFYNQFENLNIEVSADGYTTSDFYLKMFNKHGWIDSTQKKLFGRERNERLVKCKNCDIIAIKLTQDGYSPEIFNYYCRYQLEQELSCYEIMIKNIVE